MPLQIQLYGQLTDIAGKSLTLETVRDTDALKELLHRKYPALQGIEYQIAVNKQLIHHNTELPEGSIVALLPPFSGG
jgi:molybdopterin synthase sulfur carrier subunit